MAFGQQYDPVPDLRCEYNNFANYKKDCLYNLQIQLFVVFGTMIVVNNTLEVLVPWLGSFCKKKKLAKEESLLHKDDGSTVTPAEDEFLLEDYDSTLGDYEELGNINHLLEVIILIAFSCIAIQFGYVVLFILALPMTAVLALANNIIETRVDSTKIMELTKRATPHGAGDIGTWYDVFTTIGTIAIVTNTALAMFAFQDIDTYFNGNTLSKVWAFVIAEHVILIIKLAVQYFVPDEPGEVREHLAR
jgi:hypothetical protein